LKNTSQTLPAKASSKHVWETNKKKTSGFKNKTVEDKLTKKIVQENVSKSSGQPSKAIGPHFGYFREVRIHYRHNKDIYCIYQNSTHIYIYIISIDYEPVSCKTSKTHFTQLITIGSMYGIFTYIYRKNQPLI